MREVVGQSMRPRKKGAIVNFASIAGIAGMRKPLCSALYSGSKGAAAALTRQAAMEWAEYGITVNAIASGGVLTEMTLGLIGDSMDKATALVPLGRLSKPEEVASLAVYYASSLAANITGQIVVIDGGGYGAQADPGYLTPEQIAAYARREDSPHDEVAPASRIARPRPPDVTQSTRRWSTLAGCRPGQPLRRLRLRLERAAQAHGRRFRLVGGRRLADVHGAA